MKPFRGVCIEHIDKLDYSTGDCTSVGAYNSANLVHVYFHGGETDIPIGIDITIEMAERLAKNLSDACYCAKQTSSIS